jgi:hypothetical protein
MLGAGCSKSAPTVTKQTPQNEAKTVQTSTQTTPSDSEPATDTTVSKDTAAPGTAVEGAPVELSMLGLNEDKRGLRVSIKVNSSKNLKQVFLVYRCVDETGAETDNTIDNWQNAGDNGAPQPIVAGKTYETELYLYNDAAKCVELRPTKAVFEDGTEWSEPAKF